MNPVREIGATKKIDNFSNGVNPVRPFWHYTYVLESKKTGSFYTGITNNLKEKEV